MVTWIRRCSGICWAWLICGFIGGIWTLENSITKLFSVVTITAIVATDLIRTTCWKEGLTWWRHQMETFSALLAICAGNSPVTGEFPARRPVTRSFMFSLICAWIDGWVNNCVAGDLRRHRPYYDIIVIKIVHIDGLMQEIHMLLYW